MNAIELPTATCCVAMNLPKSIEISCGGSPVRQKIVLLLDSSILIFIEQYHHIIHEVSN